MDGIESVANGAPIELIVAVAAVVLFMAAAPIGAIAYRLGARAARSDARETVERLSGERDQATHELSVARLDLRDAKERRGKLQAELDDAKKILGQRDLDLERAERRATAAVDGARALGGQYDDFRSRVRAAVDGEIWSRAIGPAPRDAVWRTESRIPILAVGSSKGGVGKSTIAANLGAYFADLSPDGARTPKRVLFVDLDSQGSLSTTLFAASGAEAPPETGQDGGRVLRAFDEAATAAAILAGAPAVGVPALHRDCRFLDCAPAAAEREEKLLFEWVAQEAPRIDLRVRLAELLRGPEIQQSFDLVMLDLPPRFGALAYNGVAAATHMLIPTRHDVLSADAISRFVDFLERLRPVLCPGLKIIGIAPNMLRPMDGTRAFVEPMMIDAARRWRGDGALRLLPPIPLRTPIESAAGRGFAYLDDAIVRRAFADLGDVVAAELSLGPAVKLLAHDPNPQ